MILLLGGANACTSLQEYAPLIVKNISISSYSV